MKCKLYLMRTAPLGIPGDWLRSAPAMRAIFCFAGGKAVVAAAPKNLREFEHQNDSFGRIEREQAAGPTAIRKRFEALSLTSCARGVRRAPVVLARSPDRIERAIRERVRYRAARKITCPSQSSSLGELPVR